MKCVYKEHEIKTKNYNSNCYSYNCNLHWVIVCWVYENYYLLRKAMEFWSGEDKKNLGELPPLSPAPPHPQVWKTLDYIDSTSYKNPEHTSYSSLICNPK